MRVFGTDLIALAITLGMGAVGGGIAAALHLPLGFLLGSLLVVGLESTKLLPLERAWLRVIRPGGVILFRRNIEEASQCRALLDDAYAVASHVRHAEDGGLTLGLSANEMGTLL